MDEPIDLTKFVKSFNLTMESGIKAEVTDGENLAFLHEFKPVDIDMEFTPNASTIRQMFDYASRQVIKMEQHGRFWFDRAFDAEVVMKSLTLEPDGSYSATYESMNIIDKTDYRTLARFLRWILRR
jgi:hypothetical protein